MTERHPQIDPVQEKHYNVRERVPNWLEVFQVWHDRSTAFRQNHPHTQLDLRYGDHPKSTLDLFLPEAKGNKLSPVHIFIHGGYWQAMDKSDFSFIAAPFVKSGVACAIVNYDLCPDVDLFHIVDQMRDMIGWIWEHGESIGIDPHNIHISGHSAGGHLVGSLLTTDWKEDGNHHVHGSAIKSAISLSGLFNLTPLVHTTINANVGLNYEDAQILSPYGKKAFVNCPLLCAYGGLEGEGFAMQSEKAVEYFQNQGLPCQLLKLENATHFDAADALADEDSPIFLWAIKHALSQVQNR
ncbi:MAG: alpha/beta hydrolase [Methylocystaceae bacterium]|nr:alpha/beta hydrolase [Methylocystaceae bacterium]